MMLKRLFWLAFFTAVFCLMLGLAVRQADSALPMNTRVQASYAIMVEPGMKEAPKPAQESRAAKAAASILLQQPPRQDWVILPPFNGNYQLEHFYAFHLSDEAG